MKLNVVLLLTIVTLLVAMPFTSAQSLDLAGRIDTPTWDGTKLTDHQGYQYSVQSNGLYKVDYNGKTTYFGFGITGTYNTVDFSRLSTDYTWNNNLYTIANGYRAISATTSGEWSTQFDFTNLRTKITNTVTNKYPNNITNAKFYYLFSVSYLDAIEYDGQTYVVPETPNIHITGNLNSKVAYAKINGDVIFDFYDIIDNGFTITDVYVVPAASLGFSSTYNVLAIGFTKGNGLIQPNQVITIDPSLNKNGGSITLDGTYNYDFVNLTNGAVLYVSAYNGTGTTGWLQLNVTYDVNVDTTSSINGSKRGYTGGTPTHYDCGAGSGTRGGGGGGVNGGTSGCWGVGSGVGGGGGGGGSYATSGSAGGSGSNAGCCDPPSGYGGAVGSTYGTSNGWDIDMGAGGGAGGDGSGGAGSAGNPGGAKLRINARNLVVSGTLAFTGGNGGAGGGGGSAQGGAGAGAAGGGILINATNVNFDSATITTAGGTGGGAGRYKVFYRGTYSTTGASITSGSTYSENINSVPTVPVLTAHANYHNSVSTTVTWTASTDGQGDPITYSVKVGTTSGGTNVLNYAGDTDTTSNSFTATPQNTYYWSVRACDPYDCSAWAAESSFAWENSAPTTPSITSPTSNIIAYANTSATYTWSTSTDANGDAINYTWQFSNVSTFATIWKQNNHTNLSTGLQSIGANQQFFARVRANDNKSAQSAWSATISQRDIVLTSPANGSTQNYYYPPDQTTVNFNFTATGSTSTNFQMQVANDQYFSSIISDTTASSTSRSLSITSGSYWWRVRTDQSSSVWAPLFRLNVTKTYGGTDGLTGVQGTVYYQENGNEYPIPYAKVNIYNSTFGVDITAGANGYFSYSPLADGSIYYISAKAPNYIDSDILTFNTTSSVWTEKDIQMIPCTSSQNCGRDQVFTTFFVKDANGAKYSNVRVEKYENGSATLLGTRYTSTIDGSASFDLIRTKMYDFWFYEPNGDSEKYTIYPGSGLVADCYQPSGICYNIYLGSTTPYFNGLSWNWSHNASSIIFTVTDPNATASKLYLTVRNNTSTVYTNNWNVTPSLTVSYGVPNVNMSYNVTYLFVTTAYGNITGTFYEDVRKGYTAYIPAFNDIPQSMKFAVLFLLVLFIASMGNRQTSPKYAIGAGGVGTAFIFLSNTNAPAAAASIVITIAAIGIIQSYKQARA